MSDEPMRVLVLTSSTGGGHDTRARALRDWAGREGSQPWKVQLHQALEATHALYRVGVGAYNVIQRTWPGFHHVYYNLLEFVSFCGGSAQAVLGPKPARAPGAPPTKADIGFMPGRDGFMDFVRSVRPRLIVSTHDHLNHGFFAAAKAALPEAPPVCATYCGELEGGYGFSKHWVNPAADLFIGAVEETTAQAHQLGMAPERAWTGGFLLDPAFWVPAEAAADEAYFRNELTLEPGVFTLLLSTGANSAQNHLALLEAILADGPLPAPLQVVALCGKNEAAQRTVQEWAARHLALRVRALPHVRNLAQLMRVSSAVVARPGTGTTSEAILTGLPLLFNTLGGIMPQEMITVKFCRGRGFGRVLKRPGDLGAAVRQWLAHPAELAAEKARVTAARPATRPTDILARLQALANKRS